uniref:Uncharacterized protein n=1 Tax=Arundo donax TaxID=35708 RepID=A0A0A9DAE6_ARUDO
MTCILKMAQMSLCLFLFQHFPLPLGRVFFLFQHCHTKTIVFKIMKAYKLMILRCSVLDCTYLCLLCVRR